MSATTLSPNLSSSSSQYVFLLLAVAVFLAQCMILQFISTCLIVLEACLCACMVALLCLFVSVCVRSNLVELLNCVLLLSIYYIYRSFVCTLHVALSAEQCLPSRSVIAIFCVGLRMLLCARKLLCSGVCG